MTMVQRYMKEDGVSLKAFIMRERFIHQLTKSFSLKGEVGNAKGGMEVEI